MTTRVGLTLGIGVDIVRTSRFSDILQRDHRLVNRFIARILNEKHEIPRFRELTNIEQRIPFVAGSWAAKEAVFKTLDPEDQKKFQFKNWYRSHDSLGKPYIRSDDYTTEDEEFLLSISHDEDVLVANVMRQRLIDLKI
ncbi:4'-phosphopantetheinyl transferase superfamily [Scheffersomyces xylosifermentans]|uniref:4'-phosphopantetheinyl transferase superfamily n=1 Tax=Scheffersomyces xylosifermentans TaxID=1304137 RepID=UPI00315D106A